jgi:hypothetical protein
MVQAQEESNVKTTSVLSMLALAAGIGCAAQSARSSFKGIYTPVLLGPRDRISPPGAAPLASTKVKPFSITAFHTFSDTTYVQTTRETGALRMQAAAFEAAGQDNSLDIRLDELSAYSKGNLFGHAVRVHVEGNLCRVGGEEAGKGGKL